MAMRPPIIWIAEILLGWNSFSIWNLISMVLLIAGLSVHLMLIRCESWPRTKNLLELPITCGCMDGADFTTDERELVKFTLERGGSTSPATTAGYTEKNSPCVFLDSSNV